MMIVWGKEEEEEEEERRRAKMFDIREFPAW